MSESEWISLGEAAKVLGVHPTTVRNWADQGELPFRRTPGRHRRFHRGTLQEWATRHRITEKTPSSTGARNPQVLVEYALGHTRFNVGEDNLQQRDWYGRMSEEGIHQSRIIGRQLLDALLRHLKDENPEGEELLEARHIGEAYAAFLKKEGLNLSQVVRGFVYFDDFLIESVVQMMAPNMSATPSEWSDLLRQINAFTNEVLVTMISTFQDASQT